jgi:hypothetical protein
VVDEKQVVLGTNVAVKKEMFKSKFRNLPLKLTS